MTSKEIYETYKTLKSAELENLRKAIEPFDGEYEFNEDDRPIVAVDCLYKWEGRPGDFQVKKIHTDECGTIILEGEDPTTFGDEELEVKASEVSVSHMEFLIAEIR